MTFRLSAAAEADLADIWNWSARGWNADQEDRYLDALLDRVFWLPGHRGLWKARDDLAPGLYAYPQQSHVIYFRPTAHDGPLNEVVRILHGRMEVGRYLNA